MKTVFALAALVVVANAGAVELTGANYDAEVVDSGKAAFIKFLAPWWGHCKSMKPAWDQLGDEFADSKTVIIGDVDCTIEKDLCSKFGVKGYPTIKYFTGSTAAEGDDYKGGRDYAALKEFADTSLGPSCSPENIELCDDEQTKGIEAAQALSQEERDTQIAAKTAEIENAETTFKDELEKLQARYTELQQEKEDTVAAVSPSLRLLRSIKPKAAHDEL